MLLLIAFIVGLVLVLIPVEGYDYTARRVGAVVLLVVLGFWIAPLMGIGWTSASTFLANIWTSLPSFAGCATGLWKIFEGLCQMLALILVLVVVLPVIIVIGALRG